MKTKAITIGQLLAIISEEKKQGNISDSSPLSVWVPMTFPSSERAKGDSDYFGTAYEVDVLSYMACEPDDQNKKGQLIFDLNPTQVKDIFRDSLGFVPIQKK